MEAVFPKPKLVYYILVVFCFCFCFDLISLFLTIIIIIIFLFLNKDQKGYLYSMLSRDYFKFF